MNTITRRTALAASATLPLLPVSAYATPGNATDAAWSAYEAAKANYEANDQELSRVEGIVVDPAIAHREDHWLVSYCTLYGWMHQMNTLIAHECKIARDDFSIDMTESVLSRKVFKCMPMVRY